MAYSEPYTQSSLSVSTTELSLVSGTSTLQNVTDDGVYQVFIDFDNLAIGDVFEIKFYEKVLSGGTKKAFARFTIANDLGADCVWVSDSFLLIHGWDVTIIKISGTDRTVDASIRKVA